MLAIQNQKTLYFLIQNFLISKLFLIQNPLFFNSNSKPKYSLFFWVKMD